MFEDAALHCPCNPGLCLRAGLGPLTPLFVHVGKCCIFHQQKQTVSRPSQRRIPDGAGLGSPEGPGWARVCVGVVCGCGWGGSVRERHDGGMGEVHPWTAPFSLWGFTVTDRGSGVMAALTMMQVHHSDPLTCSVWMSALSLN